MGLGLHGAKGGLLTRGVFCPCLFVMSIRLSVVEGGLFMLTQKKTGCAKSSPLRGSRA